MSARPINDAERLAFLRDTVRDCINVIETKTDMTAIVMDVYQRLQVAQERVTPNPTMDALQRQVDSSIPPAIDRALRRDHSLCGVEPCSDCR